MEEREGREESSECGAEIFEEDFAKNEKVTVVEVGIGFREGEHYPRRRNTPPPPPQPAASARYLPPPPTTLPPPRKTLFSTCNRCIVEDILGEHADIFIEHYYIKQSGNCDLSSMSDPHDEFKGKNVLIERKESKDPSEITSKYSMRKLFEVRSRRARPHLDDKVILSWNGLAISSFSRASKILLGEAESTKFYFPVVGTEPKEYMQIAGKAALFIKKELHNAETQRLNRSFRNSPSKAPGFLDDYAFLISGLLDLYEFGGGINWLQWAIELQGTQVDISVLLRVKEDHDGAEPSGNSVSAINLIRLASMLAESKAEHYKRNAEHLLAVFEKRLKALPMAVPRNLPPPCKTLPPPRKTPPPHLENPEIRLELKK
ncbi:hypothetical protein Ahy_B09g098340 isoform A [Arachis hypogaea]|uniref:Uncharacterized protein n=1 Tax=Arachis hypogaea TaxID=3818 RepID=A0A444XR43_ARAHY|nr:hypothetical protein Ahy_B09g098340 isoform A [Arachis hypogaea]